MAEPPASATGQSEKESQARARVIGRLVAAARPLFASRGPSAVSLREVAAAAGVNYGLIYQYVGTKDDLLRSAGSMLRTLDRDVAAQALLEAGITSTPVGTDGLLVHAEAAQVGGIVFAAGTPLLELRPADGAGLEEMFLELTAETQRDTTSEIHTQGAVA